MSDSSLPSLISEIRDAIGDSRRNPGFVRTVHRFGYAFQAESAPMPHQAAAAIAGPNAWLLGRTAEVALLPGENVLGREGDGIILVKSSTVSRRHARIVIDAKGALIERSKSKNGTFVNDRRVSGPTPVSGGRSGADWIVAVHVPAIAGLTIDRNTVAHRQAATFLIFDRRTGRASLAAWRPSGRIGSTGRRRRPRRHRASIER